MKKLIFAVIAFLIFVQINAQNLTILHINAKWNQSNNFNLRGIKNCKIKMVLLEDQAPSIRSQIKAVPFIIILDKNGKPRGQWTADISFKITATKQEIQNRINVLLLEN